MEVGLGGIGGDMYLSLSSRLMRNDSYNVCCYGLLWGSVLVGSVDMYAL